MQTGLTTTADKVRQAPRRRPSKGLRPLLPVMLLSAVCMMSTPLTASSADGSPIDEQMINSESSYPAADATLSQSSAATATSAADLSLFGILALGIIGLLWVRRHASEL